MKFKRLKAPFPYFGGKSTVGSLVWDRLGDVDNFIEPFCGSAAMLLARPANHEGRVETVNDADCYLANVWRALRADPDAVAAAADWPVNEADLFARHNWLVYSPAAAYFRERIRNDPEYNDPKIAGWWIWGACCWIGSGWCSPRGVSWNQTINAESRGVHRGRPQLADAYDIGRGVHGTAVENKRPRAHRHHRNGGGAMPGVHGTAKTVWDQMPCLGANDGRGSGVVKRFGDGTCRARREWLIGWFAELQDRFREVRVCCGDWKRVCDSHSTLTRLGTTGLFLDPPYRKTLKCGAKNREANLYANDGEQDVNALCDDVHAWCLKWGEHPEMRIALCGLDGEYDLPGWDVVAWKTSGGYGNQSGKVNDNAARERIWFSPGCLRERGLFE